MQIAQVVHQEAQAMCQASLCAFAWYAHEMTRLAPVMMPVRPLLVGSRPALAAAELGSTDCTKAPDDTLNALAT